MKFALPHRSCSRYAIACLLTLGLFVGQLPRGVAAADAPLPPTITESSTRKQQPEGSQDRTGPVSAGEDSTSRQQSAKGRDLLTKFPVLQDFKEWVELFKIAGLASASEQKGHELAQQRRAVIAQLIEDDPQSAIELAVPAYVRQRMPQRIQQQVEEEISGYGDYLVMVFDEIDPVTGQFTRGRIERKVVINGRTYRAQVYGRKLGMTTKLNIPLRGVVMGDVIALAESPVRVLDPDERDMRTGGQGIDVEVGGKVRHFDDQEQLDRFEEKLKKHEMTIGPNGPRKVSAEEPSEENEAKATDANAIEDDNITAEASSWTEGPKTVLVMRIDFSDMPGEPIDGNGNTFTAARAQNLLDVDVNNFYKTGSYNKTSLSTTVTSVLRMPMTADWYGRNNEYFQLLFDARAAAQAKGYDPNKYHLDIVAFKRITKFTWAGLGFIGGKGSWLNGFFDLRVTGHEIGHNYGLYHANLWKTTNGTISGTGTSVEYADPFDAMGNGNTTSSHHFNAWFKNRLNWVPNTSVLNVAASGTYRIQPYDLITSTGRRALKIQRDASTHYWVEFRQAITESAFVSNGAVIHWGYSENRQSNLLDMTPTSTDGAFDSPLAIGKSFIDTPNGIKITPVGKSSTFPPSLDVNVTYTTNLITLALNPSPVIGSQSVNGTVTLNAPAPTMGAEVKLSDNLAATTLPATVFIQSGAKSTSFSITTKAVSSNQSGIVTASYRGINKTSPLTVQPISVASLTLNKSSMGGGGTITGTVRLNAPAPASGATVSLSDDIPAANTPANITIPAGTTTKTFSITTVSVSANQSGNITASYGGVSRSAPFTVVPLALSHISINPNSVAGGVNTRGAVVLNGPAPPGGVVVSLSDNIPATTLPASITIPEGVFGKYVTITSTVVGATQSGQVTGTLGAVTKTAALTIRPPALFSLTLNPASVAGGNNVAGTVSLDGPAPSAGAVITLSDNLSTATTPASVTIPAGVKSANFTITTAVVSGAQIGQVTASRGGITKTSALTVRPVSVQSITVNPNPISGGSSATGTIVLERVSSSNTLVTLSDNLPATTIPATVTVPANTLSMTFQITTVHALPSQNGILSATANSVTRTLGLSVVNTQSQLLANAGFELGRVSWIVSSPGGVNKVIYQALDGESNSGSWAAFLGGYATPVSEHLYQEVIVPSNALTADLNFYLWLPTQETALVPNDTLEVQIQDSSGTVLATVATYSNLNKTDWYVKKSIDLLAYKGQTIRVRFLSTTNQSSATWFFLDDITIDVIR